MSREVITDCNGGQDLDKRLVDVLSIAEPEDHHRSEPMITAATDNDHRVDNDEDREEGVEAGEGDNIGDTVFSKHWLFQCLINTVNIINGEKSADTNGGADGSAVGDDNERLSSSSAVVTAFGPQEPIELDDRTDEELSILWDMSTNEDVMAFLNDYKAIDLFETILMRTNSPRFAEISAGILANIAVNRDICVNLANRPLFRQLILESLSSSDTPFVIQVVRIVSASLSNGETQDRWLAAIKERGDQFLTTIHHTLENCLNCDLLRSEILLLNKMLYLDDTMAAVWLAFDRRYECVKTLLSATDQLLADDPENVEFVDYLWLIIHTLSLAGEDFTETQLVANRPELLRLFHRYVCDSFGDSVDYVIASGHRAGALSAAISLVNQILCLSTGASVEALFTPSLVNCLQQLRDNCDEYLRHLREESTRETSFEMASDALSAIHGIYREFCQKRLVSIDIPQSR